MANSISDVYANINLLGRIFNREKDAARIIDEIKNELRIVARKVAGIPQSERKRVIRLMGRDQVMTPGDDSFQNEYIRLAGGIPPRLGKDGSIAAVTKEEWMRFNPQIIYGCGGDRETAKKFFDRPGWRDVEAVRNDKIFFFPCDLTCRASTRAGYFVSWLSAKVYEDEFLREEGQVLEDHVFKSRNLDIDLDYIRDVRISCSTIHDFSNKTLIIDFTKPLSLVSTLEGERRGIESIGNHYSSPPCWGIGHKLGLEEIRKRVYQAIGKSEDTASFLFTGADMDNLRVKPHPLFFGNGCNTPIFAEPRGNATGEPDIFVLKGIVPRGHHLITAHEPYNPFPFGLRYPGHLPGNNSEFVLYLVDNPCSILLPVKNPAQQIDIRIDI